MNIAQAVAALYPHAVANRDFRVELPSEAEGAIIRHWNVRDPLDPDRLIPPPTPDDLARGWALHQSRAYRGERAALYPPIGDQLDALWKICEAIALGQAPPPDAAAVHRQVCAVKAAHPKSAMP